MGFFRLVFSTYTGFVAADWLSDRYFKKHNSLDYGYLNRFLGKRTKEEWWGTRLEHNITLPAYMTTTAIISSKFWGSYARRRNKSFTLHGTPLAYLFHCYSFVHLGIMAYVAHNAFLNPNVRDKQEYILSNLGPTSLGSITMLSFPFTEAALGKIATALPILKWVLLGAIAGGIHYGLVKSVGFGDHLLPDSLTDIEKEFNGISCSPDDDI